ncbi:hypothetical protein LTR05_001759 [Lithohypha guttulata]|uniref:Uncharacterized protein n=1 Tax=Lithohypha guttulata TaxID=1690604 RepID=A0AAN7TEX2_9EURO|nr:hypothetical protein LTR05_001759 [Lithohypha guttulata]
MAQVPGQQLSNKDLANFRQVVRHFEGKQYKKGLKVAEQVLKKNPNHADTQAMKALILHSQGHSQDAFDLAKIALKNNMKSHVCWHVYGLLWRGEKNFEEAIKAYKFALRLEPESQPIQRDLAHLQVQMRDYEGYIESRRNMLQQKPGIRQNWTALAIAHHLSGGYEDAENVLTTFEDTVKNNKPARTDIEHWEAVLYKNYIIAESGNLEKALDHLDAIGKRSPDVTGVMEMRADYLLRLDRKKDAEAAYSALLDRNPENSTYFDGWIKAKDLQDAEPTEAKKAYDGVAAKYPRSDLPRRRPLDFLSGDAFRQAVNAYLIRMLRRGVPSTFANIKQLYGDKSKLSTVEELVEGYQSGTMPNTTDDSKPATEKEQENFKWSVPYFLAQHYNFITSRNLPKALEYADRCIAIDSKSVDFHAVKARTYKYMGNTYKASELMTQAQSLDLKDRAINTKAAKYLLRNDQNEDALAMAGKFTQNKTSGGPLADLLDMQCIWYLTEDGQAYIRQRKLGLALKRFHQIFNIFEVWQDDQFDFHNFSLRKGMIRAYVDMLRWEDHLRDHPFYSRMAISAIKAYLLLADNPDLAHGPILNGVNGSTSNGKLSEVERKKALKKARKEQDKLEKAEADKKALAKASKPVPKAEQEDVKKEDADPLGKTLVETKTPLDDAMKFLGPLLEFCGDLLDAQKVGFEVYIRRRKYLLAAKCLLKVRELASEDADAFVFAYQLRHALESNAEGIDGKVTSLVKELAKDALQLNVPAKEFIEKFRKENESTSIRHVQAYAKVKQFADASTQADNEKLLLESVSKFEDARLEDLTAGLEILQDWGSSSDVLEKYKTEARKSWPGAAVFQDG